MDNCIFCKIANGEIPTNKVYEDEVVIAFLDMSQITKGHTLLVPKKHVQDIFGYSSNDAGAVFKRIPLIANALNAAFPEMEGLNILNNNGETAFQTVMHSHIHLIPRYSKENDGFGLKWEPAAEGTYSDQDLKDIASTINQQIEG
ncbi:HIT family protein [Aerococcus sp. 1KP-2016]|jgi:histidine triad (HIT) family protein|uniref:HIT family protein n=1 Tax=Aerococcus sp. 1KP-2016 TaxID=1981982 RepID=UPI000B98E810|nr:HIT family protein [Aerococcus sp. 1KP-2016]OYQ66408.1 HIT family protein [Aerococcus sp. 1KP-2016]